MATKITSAVKSKQAFLASRLFLWRSEACETLHDVPIQVPFHMNHDPSTFLPAPPAPFFLLDTDGEASGGLLPLLLLRVVTIEGEVNEGNHYKEPLLEEVVLWSNVVVRCLINSIMPCK